MKYNWNAYPISFGFYTVFLAELEDYIIKKVLAVDAKSFDKLPREDFEEYFKSQEVLFHIGAMKKRKSRKFELALQEVFDELTRSGYIVRVFEYVRGNKEVSSEFIRFLLDQIYTHEHFKHDLQVQESFTGILGYMLNTHTRPVILEYLMERTEAINHEDRLRTWSYLVYFTNEPEVLQLMLDKSRQNNLSVEERKVLANNFQRMLKAEDFPQEQKKKVEQQYNKMRYETRQE